MGERNNCKRGNLDEFNAIQFSVHTLFFVVVILKTKDFLNRVEVGARALRKVANGTGSRHVISIGRSLAKAEISNNETYVSKFTNITHNLKMEFCVEAILL